MSRAWARTRRPATAPLPAAEAPSVSPADARVAELVAQVTTWHGHLRAAMPADEADDDAVSWLATRLAETATGFPALNAMHVTAPAGARARHMTAWHAALPVARQAIAAVVAGDQATLARLIGEYLAVGRRTERAA